MNQKLKFYSEIEGLRALAILPVILFHFDYAFFSGGYVGVDIFFVISGFLITRLLIHHLADGSFSFIDFFERRSRRLLPALILVSWVSLVIGFVLLEHEYFIDLTYSAVAQTFFSANMYFWSGTGYFDLGSLNKPLLHTWSLSIEEQFYFGITIFLMLWALICRKSKVNFQKSIVYPIVILLLISFFLNYITVSRFPSATFYLLPTRLWELLIGSCLIFVTVRKRSYFAESACLMGLALLIYSILTFNKTTIFPGLMALFPTVGTALLIYAIIGESVIAKHILTFRAFKVLGKLSYSIYLWHWPLWIFYLQLPDYFKSEVSKVILLCLTLCCAFASYKILEDPIRKRKLLTDKALFWKVLLISQSVILVVASFDSIRNTFTKVTDPVGYRYLMAETDLNEEIMKCHDRYKQDFDNDGLCQIGNKEASPSILFWGDSLAGFASEGVSLALNNAGLSALQLTRGGCPPVLSETFNYVKKDKFECNEIRQSVFKFIKKKKFKTVILMAYWNSYFNYNEPGNEFLVGLDKTIKSLKEAGMEVVLLENPPIYNASVADFLYNKHKKLEDQKSIENIRNFGPQILKISEENSLYVIHTYGLFCRDQNCIIEENGYSLYRDEKHLSSHGSVFFGDRLKSAFEKLSKNE
ncbi:MAG: peptidoglycan/LPS O-acetylase OafA/YrhL [Parasphingorhabdus sp.]|jgi:peptidoglycan/LPS O-acetylase OafA/YrhL